MVHQRGQRVKPALSLPGSLLPDTGVDKQSPPPPSPAYAVSSSSIYQPSSPVHHSRRVLVPDNKKEQRPPSFFRNIFASPLIVAMLFLFSCLLVVLLWMGDGGSAKSYQRGMDPRVPRVYSRQSACPDYTDYSTRKHAPFSTGPYQLPFQRPVAGCRLFKSTAAEALITQMTARMADPDLARLFENCFPNTLDTTVRWHLNAAKVEDKQSFIVTGDINAQWLRDSTNQLSQYQLLVPKDDALKNLVLGAINTQVRFV